MTRIVLAVLFIATLLTASLWILRPFLTSFVWATMIVVATWPVLLWLQARFGNSRSAAVIVMLALILMVVVVPFLLAVFTVIEKGDDIARLSRGLAGLKLPPPPEWVANIPLVGKAIANRWDNFNALSHQEIQTQLGPYASKATRWFVAQAGNAAVLGFQFLLMIIVSGVLYARGEAAAAGVRRFARRLAGKDGEEAAILAAKAVRGVALGVVVTAIIQSFIGGLGLVLTGIPAAALLTAVIFVLCLAQLGPALAMIPAVVWLYWEHGVLWGTLLLIFTLVAQVIDNIIRPVFIRKGVNLSLFLIIPGVIGGLLAFGVMGLFIGPVVLAVAYTLLKVWVSQGESIETSPGQPPASPL